jgi:DNA-binding transcriptional ArsR family regulator
MTESTISNQRSRASILDAEKLDEDELAFIFERAAQYFALLSEPARLRIIQAVCSDERSVQEVVVMTSLPQPNVSRHLSLLYRAGALSRRREGTFVFYKIADPMITDLCRSVCVRLAGG